MTEKIEMNDLPIGFSDEITTQLGPDISTRLLAALATSPDVSVRLNVRKQEAHPQFEDAESVPWCESGIYLSSRPKFTLDPLLHAGAYYVQDASSMIYQRIIASISEGFPLMVADLCAAPGGKTTAMLNAIPDGSTLLANEFMSARAKVLKENLVKYGYPGVVVTNSDVKRVASLGPMFDIVAVDAPCSGEGMMRKEEVARSQWSPGLVEQCAALQKEILAEAVKLVKPGGYLIYSTCTFNTSEDEDNAAWIADELDLTPVDTGLAGNFGIRPQAKGELPCLRFIPGFTRGEGLFLALFRKDSDELSSGLNRDRRSKRDKKKPEGMKIDKSLLAKASGWIDGNLELRTIEDRLQAYTPEVARLVDSMPKDVRIISAGVEVAEVKGRDLIPAHQLAMSTVFTHPFPEVELTEENAVAYLMREPITLPPAIPKGFVTATYHGLPLGFLKNLGSRSNNLYPVAYRILHR